MFIILNNIIILSMDLSITVRLSTHIITYCIRYIICDVFFQKEKGVTLTADLCSRTITPVANCSTFNVYPISCTFLFLIETVIVCSM